MAYKINNTNLFLKISLATWRNEEVEKENIPKAKIIQRVIDNIDLRHKDFIDKHGCHHYNSFG